MGSGVLAQYLFRRLSILKSVSFGEKKAGKVKQAP